MLFVMKMHQQKNNQLSNNKRKTDTTQLSRKNEKKIKLVIFYDHHNSAVGHSRHTTVILKGCIIKNCRLSIPE